MDKQVAAELRKVSSPERARANAWFFKTGKGQYGEGDMFIGVTLPNQRLIAKKYFGDMTLTAIGKLLNDPIHEFRLTALIMLVYKFEKESDERKRKIIFDFYINNRAGVNNWDLIDSSAGQIVGGYLHGKDKAVLTKLAKSDRIWDRRIAMISTSYDIGKGDPTAALKIAEILIYDNNDLVRKAVGWMLREVGKRCGEKILTDFLDRYYRTMPRTSLRYAIERLDSPLKRHYMKKPLHA